MEILEGKYQLASAEHCCRLLQSVLWVPLEQAVKVAAGEVWSDQYELFRGLKGGVEGDHARVIHLLEHLR